MDRLLARSSQKALKRQARLVSASVLHSLSQQLSVVAGRKGKQLKAEDVVTLQGPSLVAGSKTKNDCKTHLCYNLIGLHPLQQPVYECLVS